jgi:hypothetical protein
MNYFLSLQEQTGYRTGMMSVLAFYILVLCLVRYYSTLTVMKFMLQYFESTRIVSFIESAIFRTISISGFCFIQWAIRYIDDRLPSLMRPYVLLIAFLYVVLFAGYAICFGLVFPFLSALFNYMFH